MCACPRARTVAQEIVLNMLYTLLNQIHACMRARVHKHACTHARTHTHTHARARARTHTHAHVAGASVSDHVGVCARR